MTEAVCIVGPCALSEVSAQLQHSTSGTVRYRCHEGRHYLVTNTVLKFLI